MSQQIADSTDVSTKGISGSRTIRYVLMPTRAGILNIHIPKIICFDPQAKSFLPTDDFNIPISVATSSSPVETTKIAETEFEDEFEEKDQLQTLSEHSREILFYTALAILIMLIIFYSVKSSSQKREEYATSKQGADDDMKSTLNWHLPYIIGILLLICCLALLW